MIDLKHLLVGKPGYQNKRFKLDILGDIQLAVIAHDGDEQVVKVNVPVVKRADGAVACPLFYEVRWLQSVISSHAEFKRTVQLPDRSRKLVDGILTSLESSVNSGDKLGVANVLPLIPALKQSVPCTMEVISVHWNDTSVTQEEIDMVESFIGMSWPFTVPLLSSDLLQDPTILMRAVGLANKTGLSESLGSLMGNGSSSAQSLPTQFKF